VRSSDRRVGARRIPTQLLESAAGLLIAMVSLLLVAALNLPVHGAVFLGAFAAYAIVRQLLLRLRVERRRSCRTLPATAVAAAAVVLVVALSQVAQWQ
jgi:phosphatidylglycerol:prolipoprotein diacylglycerol transferase